MISPKRRDLTRHGAGAEPIKDTADESPAPRRAEPAEEPPAPRRAESAIRPPLVEDPSLVACLEELDELVGGPVSPDSYVPPPPLMARLVVPRPSGRGWQPIEAASAESLGPDSISRVSLGELDRGLHDVEGAPDVVVTPSFPTVRFVPAPAPAHDEDVDEAVSTYGLGRDMATDWMMSATLILMLFAGAAAAALVFHARLADIVVQFEASLR